jgi:hypothetical protein
MAEFRFDNVPETARKSLEVSGSGQTSTTIMICPNRFCPELQAIFEPF